jgi:hypothetical protein
MYSVKWITHQSECEPISIETSANLDLDELVSSCLNRLISMRLNDEQTSPDGFLIFDREGKEVRRWFGFPRVSSETEDASPQPAKEICS